MPMVTERAGAAPLAAITPPTTTTPAMQRQEQRATEDDRSVPCPSGSLRKPDRR